MAEAANEIKIYKMITGDLVMGKLDDENSTEDTIRLLKPMSIMLDPAQGGVGLIPYDVMFTQEELDEFDFQKKHIIHEVKVHETFADAYIKQTTGIEIAQPTLEV